MKKILCGLLIYFYSANNTYGQREPILSFFQNQLNVFNPAAAGYESNTKITLTSRNQWLSIENAPKGEFFTISSERKNNVGLGISFISNRLFVESSSNFSFDFSYRLILSNNSKIQLGIKVGSDFFRLDTKNLVNFDNDPSISNFSSFNPNLGLGLLFLNEKFWFSVSTPRIFTSQNQNIIVSPLTYIDFYAAMGYKFELFDDFSLKSNLIYRQSKNDNFAAINTYINYNNLFDFGIIYKTSNSLGFQGLINFKNFNLGYTYSTSSSFISSNLGVTSHEVLLSFNLGLKSNSISEGENNSDAVE